MMDYSNKLNELQELDLQEGLSLFANNDNSYIIVKQRKFFINKKNTDPELISIIKKTFVHEYFENSNILIVMPFTTKQMKQLTDLLMKQSTKKNR
jgi:hypothetical protein